MVCWYEYQKCCSKVVQTSTLKERFPTMPSLFTLQNASWEIRSPVDSWDTSPFTPVHIHVSPTCPADHVTAASLPLTYNIQLDCQHAWGLLGHLVCHLTMGWGLVHTRTKTVIVSCIDDMFFCDILVRDASGCVNLYRYVIKCVADHLCKWCNWITLVGLGGGH